MEILERLNELRNEFQEYYEEISLTMARIDKEDSKDFNIRLLDLYIDVVLKKLDVSKRDFLNKRDRTYLYYRQSLMAWARFNTALSLKEIGKYFYKHHSTVIHSVQCVKDALSLNSRNQELSDIYYKIKEELD